MKRLAELLHYYPERSRRRFWGVILGEVDNPGAPAHLRLYVKAVTHGSF